MENAIRKVLASQCKRRDPRPVRAHCRYHGRRFYKDFYDRLATIDPAGLPAAPDGVRLGSPIRRLDLNGQRTQTGNTRTMIFSVAQLVACLSLKMVLEPGDAEDHGSGVTGLRALAAEVAREAATRYLRKEDICCSRILLLRIAIYQSASVQAMSLPARQQTSSSIDWLCGICESIVSVRLQCRGGTWR